MRLRIRQIEPPVLDETVDAADDASQTPDYGPNADAVRGLLRRASSLTRAQVKRLADEVAWRSWAVMLPPGGGIAAARATAAVCARRSGRGSLVAVLDDAVREALGANAANDRARRAVLDAVEATALADVLPDETVQLLKGAWRTVAP